VAVTHHSPAEERVGQRRDPVTSLHAKTHVAVSPSAMSRLVAVGAVAAFRDYGLAVPQDVSVAGFDDIETLRDLVPTLTTVHLDLQDIGSRAAALALDSELDAPVRLVRVRGEVVLRDSTRPLAELHA
jgi:DNA-binding LacI/PurR family transcriptional regulator